MNTAIIIILINIVVWASLLGIITNLQINVAINWVLGLATIIAVLGVTAIGCKIFYYFASKKDEKKNINERKKIYNSNGQISKNDWETT